MNRPSHWKVSFAAFFVSFCLLIIPALAFAGPGTAGGNPPPGPGNTSGGNPPPGSVNIKIENPLANGVNTIPGFIELVISNIVLPIGAILAVLYIIYAGFLMVTARGNEAQLKEAKAAFFNAAIGTGILLGSWVIARVVQNTICAIATCQN